MRLLIECRNNAVAVEGGRLVSLQGDFDKVLRIGEGDICPGLINAHDHLHRNHYGRMGRPPYANAYDWAHDIQAHDTAVIAAGRALSRREALRVGAWKNLIAGVTHVVHHDRWEEDFEKDFPLTVIPVAQADSLGMTPGDIPDRLHQPFTLHLAEGIDARAAAEIETAETRGLLTPDLLAVHGVGVDAPGIDKLRSGGAALIHCPSSNHFLFGRTAPAALLHSVDVLLGTDSLLTGAGTLLDEIALARPILGDARLLEAVGPTAARRLHIPVPSLAPGTAADLVLLRKPLCEARLEDVALVVARGRLAVLDPVLGQLPDGALYTWRGVTRWLAEPLRTCIA